MYDRLNKYIAQNNFLHPLVHGFQTGHSTVIALMNLQDKITEAIDKNEFSLGIFIDLAKAFLMQNQREARVLKITVRSLEVVHTFAAF